MAQKVIKTKYLPNSDKKEVVFKLIEKERGNIFNIVNDLILVADVKTGMLVDANLTAQNILGKNLSQIRTMHQSQIHLPSEAVKYRQIFKQHIKAGRGILQDIYIVDRHKKLIPFDVNIKLLKINHKMYALGIFRNSSERNKTEEELKISLDKYEVLADNNPDFIFVVDRNYKILNLNRSAANLLRKKPESLIGQSIKQIFPPSN